MTYFLILCRRLANCALIFLLFATVVCHAESDVTLLGRITDEQGKPIPNANLVVRYYDRHHSGSSGVFWIGDRDEVFQTNEEGYFAVDAASSEQRLSVFAEGFAPMQRIHRAFKGENPNWDFTLVKSAHVFCKILDTNGKPQSNRFLRIMKINDPAPPSAPGMEYLWHAMDSEAISAPDGAFEIKNLSPGSYSIIVTTPWKQSKQDGNGLIQFPVSGDQFKVSAGQVITNFEIRVRPPEDFVVAGHIYRSDGSPMPNVSVRTRSGSAKTDSDGFFRIEGLDNFESDTLPLRLNSKVTLPDVTMSTTNLNFVWPGTGTIEGRVFDASTKSNLTRYAATLSRVKLKNNDAVFDKPATQLAQLPEGRFRLSTVPEGIATVVVSNQDLGVRQFTVEVKADQTTEVDCPLLGPAVLEGFLTFNGKPHRSSVVLNGEWTYADADGHYRFENQPDGKQTLWFFNHEYSHRYADVELIADQTVQQDMNLGGTATVEGTILFPADGSGDGMLRLTGRPSSLTWNGGRPHPEERVLAIAPIKSSEPDFSLKHLPSGHYYLTVGIASGFRYKSAWTQEINLEEDKTLTLNIDLTNQTSDSSP